MWPVTVQCLTPPPQWGQWGFVWDEGCGVEVESMADLALGPRSRLGKREKEEKKKQPGSSARGLAQLPQTIRQQSTKKWKKENRRNMYFIVFLNRLWGKGLVWKAALICQELWPRQAEQCNAYRAVAVEKGWGGSGWGCKRWETDPTSCFSFSIVSFPTWPGRGRLHVWMCELGSALMFTEQRSLLVS